MIEPLATATNEVFLDNPIWHSLTTTHAGFALGAQAGKGLARRYPTDIGPLAAFQEPTAAAYSDLAQLIPEGDHAILLLQQAFQPTHGWRLLRSAEIVQMICYPVPGESRKNANMVALGPADYPEMLALATLTEPGPFRSHTAELGGFLGIRSGGRLAAMAGQRLAPTGFAEVSAVCTHPDFRGKGYARSLVAEVARNIHASHRIPFLTSLAANGAANGLYQELGFSLRRHFQLAVIQPLSVTRE